MIRWCLIALACWFLPPIGLDAADDVANEQRTPKKTADLVLTGGKVITVDKELPQAQAVAVGGDRIVAVGTEQQIASFIGSKTQVLKLKGRLLVPGFIEGHGHFLGLGQAKRMLDLTKAKTWDEVIAMVAAAAKRAEDGEWIVGRGWHQEKWSRRPEPHVDGYPTHTALSRVSPTNPVLLTHASGHMCFANARAMQRARITRDTKAPEGGEIVRDAAGDPIGVFRETAQAPIHSARSAALQSRTRDQRQADLLRVVELAMAECLENGVTSFQDAGSSFSTIDAFRQLADAGQLKVRLWVMVRAGNGELARRLPEYRLTGVGNHHLTVRAIKRSIDGALGAHGAWLLAPYEDLPESIGLNTASIASIRETARLARRHDFQLCVHAIGDRANRETLNIFESVLKGDIEKSNDDKSDRRWRIEHAQHLHPTDIPRFGKLGVIASMQAIHCTSDAVFVVQRLGQRRAGEGAYVWRSLIDSGVVLCNGTDAPVEDISPIKCFYSSVTRKLSTGVEFFPEQCMTREEALRSYTLQAAYAAFEEDLKGSITPGKLADLVVLSRDIMKCPANEIPNTKVDMTIVGGKIVFKR